MNHTVFPTAFEGALRRSVPGLGQASAVQIDARAIDEALLHDWQALDFWSIEANVFNESRFLPAALAHCDPHGAARLFTLWDGAPRDSQLIGLMPLSLERRYGARPIPHWQNWLHPNAFLGNPLIAPGRERTFWSALLTHLDAAPGRGLFFHLDGLSLDGPIAEALFALCADEHRRCDIVRRHERAFLGSDLSAEAYYEQAVRSKKRKEQRRQKRRLEELGRLEFLRSDGRDGLDRWIDAFLSLEAAGWKGQERSALGSQQATRALFRDMLGGMARAGRLELLSLEFEGAPIAMLVNLQSGGGVFSFKTTFDESFRPLFARRAAADRKLRAARPAGDRLGGQLRGARSSDDRQHVDRAPGHRARIDRHRRCCTAAGIFRSAQGGGHDGRAQPRTRRRRHGMNKVFGDAAIALFARNYPETPHRLDHQLPAHALLTLEAIARLGEALPRKSVEYNPGDLPVGIDAGAVPDNGLSIGETIRTIDVCRSWAVLKNIEQMPDYEALLLDLLGELKPAIESKTGRMLRPQGFIFVSSPGSMTPYHFDPEHNILLQLRGSKTMTQFPAGDARFAPPTSHEAYHSGHQRNLAWSDEFLSSGLSTELAPGQAVFVPVMAPHFVRNGPEPSISLSITWRSDWSFAEADAHAFNRLLRGAGLNPTAPGRFPASNKGKAYAYRALRKMGIAG